MTAKELKNATGEVVRSLRRGERILLTFRGKALGTIEPVRADETETTTIPPFDEAWADIEDQLKRSTPRFASWQDAEDHSRGRR